MSVKVEVSEVVNRPVVDVFRFYAYDHVRNHPRWDPNMELKQVSIGPIGVGTVIHRRNTHFGTPVEGEMKVVEFKPNKVFAVLIHDGPDETHGRVTFEPTQPDKTTITISAEFPSMDESSMDTNRLTTLMKRTASNIKRLIESEV